MNSFDVDIISLFIDKHGKDLYDNIINQIEKEKDTTLDNEYIDLIFNIAFFDFIGVKRKVINKMYQNKDINRILKVHKSSINMIEKKLDSGLNDKK